MHLIENKGVKSECMKFGENSRQMPSVSAICDEYCRSYLLNDLTQHLHFVTYTQSYIKRTVLALALPVGHLPRGFQTPKFTS